MVKVTLETEEMESCIKAKSVLALTFHEDVEGHSPVDAHLLGEADPHLLLVQTAGVTGMLINQLISPVKRSLIYARMLEALQAGYDNKGIRVVNAVDYLAEAEEEGGRDGQAEG